MRYKETIARKDSFLFKAIAQQVSAQPLLLLLLLLLTLTFEPPSIFFDRGNAKRRC